MLVLHFTRISGSTQTEDTPCSDEQYAQSSEGPGDSAVTWRRRRALLAPRTGTLVIPNREFVGIPSPRFFISVHGSVDILPDEGMPQAIEVVGKTEQQGLANLYR